MNNSYIEIIDSDENKKSQILIEGVNYCNKSFVRENNLYVYDVELFDNLRSFGIGYLLNIFERITITYEMTDDVWLDVVINPYWFHFESGKERLRASATMRYGAEDWNKLWSIKQHSKLFFEKVKLVDGAEVCCDIIDKDEQTGEPIYNLLDEFGLGIAIEDKSILLGDVYDKVSRLCIFINDEVINHFAEKNNTIERSIEFPPEYHQAGLDILNYFGTYLREQYPEETATVKIEQLGLNVRMVVETQDGRTETVEKALHEYELIVTGSESPEKFTKNDKLLFELKNELRIAQFRLEAQQDLIGMQNNRIDQLLSLVGNALSQDHQVTIDFKPKITLSSNIENNQYVVSALGNINELLEKLPQSSDAHVALRDLEDSLTYIQSDADPESVSKSPAMNKFRRLIDKAVDNGSELYNAFNKAESGWEIFKELAGKYNNIAEWCGLPVVPSNLLK